MQRLKWQLYRITDRLGFAWWGLPLLTPAIALCWLLACVPLKQQRHQLEQQYATTLRQAPPAAMLSPADAFLQEFPAVQTANTQLQTLYDLAAKQQLGLSEVRYQRERKREAGLEQYHINFSLDARYPAIKHFLLDALAALPYASLDRLQLSRDNAQTGTVYADIRLTLHLRTP